MKFTETPLRGAFVIELEPHSDQRGFFSRAFCAAEFEAQGIKHSVAQANISVSHEKGTMRGLHYQTAPATESKFFRCIKGRLYDVMIDLRVESPTYLQHFGIELSAANRIAVYVPAMFAHGFVSMEDNTEVFYTVGEFYTPDSEKGIRYDDPRFDIRWPVPVTEVSEKDSSWPDFQEENES